VIDAYVTELGAALRGPNRRRADILAEVRDSLVDASEAYESDGLTREEAERLAVDEFGAVRRLAPSFQAELGYAEHWRLALLVVAAIAPQGLVWNRGTHPTSGHTALFGFLRDFVVGVGGLGIVAAVALLLVSTYGVRWIGIRSEVTRWAGVAGLAFSALVVSIGLVLMATNPTDRSLLDVRVLPWTLAFVVLPMGLVARSARRCLTFSQRAG
jgi:hypothetical protein